VVVQASERPAKRIPVIPSTFERRDGRYTCTI
jgi:hypothetical protein